MEVFQELPSEIVAEIFYRCLPSTTYIRPSLQSAPLLLTHICSSWRKIAHQTPILWSSLSLVPQLLCDNCSNNRGVCLSGCQFEHWRRYGSESLPFDLHIIFPRRHAEADSAQICFEALIPKIAQNTCNIRRLYINSDNIKHLGPLLSLTPSSMPNLEAVHLNFWSGLNTPYYLRKIQFPSGAPHLRRVILDHPLPKEETMLLPLSQLTHLVITSGISRTKFSTLLADCTVLEEFSCVLYSNDGSGIGTNRTTSLRLLDMTLDFDDGIPPASDIFLSIRFPFLENFALRTRPGGAQFQWKRTTARDHLFEELRNLKTLQLGFQGISSDDLANLLDSTPNLIKLCLDCPDIDYVWLLSALTHSPSRIEDQLFLPRLEYLELYVDFSVGSRDASYKLFRPSQFMDMITSRSLSHSITSSRLGALVPLRQVHVIVDSSTDRPNERVDTKLLKRSAQDFQASNHQLTLTISDSLAKTDWMQQTIRTWSD